MAGRRDGHGLEPGRLGIPVCSFMLLGVKWTSGLPGGNVKVI